MRKTFPNYGVSVFPSPSADRHGRRINRTPLRRCIQCGFPNDTRNTAWSDSGDGLGPETTVTVTAVPGQTNADTVERDVLSGCRFCGSLHWQMGKPEKLPDDRNFPSFEARHYRRKQRR